MRRRRLRYGLSLWELLTVLLIIGVLVVLLLPAIQAAREAARRTQCNNNLKNVAFGLQNYHDTYSVFPMGAMHAGLNPGESNPDTASLGPSWWYGIQPFVQCCSLYDRIRASQRPGVPDRYEFCADDLNPYLAALPPGHSCCNPAGASSDEAVETCDGDEGSTVLPLVGGSSGRRVQPQTSLPPIPPGRVLEK